MHSVSIETKVSNMETLPTWLHSEIQSKDVENNLCDNGGILWSGSDPLPFVCSNVYNT